MRITVQKRYKGCTYAEFDTIALMLMDPYVTTATEIKINLS